eukprot:768452-Hanusia_phi.AAC.2
MLLFYLLFDAIHFLLSVFLLCSLDSCGSIGCFVRFLVIGTNVCLFADKMRTILYGKKAANLYTQAFVQNTQARALYQESEDTYYRANDAASYDDWRRARHQWDYFYNRH